MKALRYYVFALVLSAAGTASAGEGMWIPSLLDAVEDDMIAMGMKLSAEDIYNINNSSLKDAVIHFNGGCTAEIVSDQGLIFTNHHCGYGQIQEHSTLENNYLVDGFWAMSREEELPCDGLYVTRIVSITDVTDEILNGITASMSEAERSSAVNANISNVKAGLELGPAEDAIIKAFYYGNEYYMIITETFNDVRLVGAPPSSIGKYGFDTDNWVWPRHTGDFSVFRIYAGPDNEPAAYSPDNQPYQPIHYFPISMDPQEEGDFTMIYGFPGTTQQYLTSYAVDYKLNVENPARIEMRDASLAILWTDMNADEEVKLQYAAKQSSISNSWKKWKGENKGLITLDALNVKRELEARFQEAVEADASLDPRYKTLLSEFETLYKDQEKYAMSWYYFVEMIYYGPSFIRYANNYQNIVENYSVWDQSTRDAEVSRLLSNVEGYFKNYNAATDQRIFIELFTIYLENLDPELHPEIADEIEKKYKGSVKDYAHYLYNKSIFIKQSSVESMLNNFSSSSVKKIKKDPAYILMQDMYAAFYDKARETYLTYIFKESELMRLYVKAMSEVLPEEVVWPDANSTLRVGFGKVEGSYPRDGMHYTYYTTLAGVIEKYVEDDPEFDLPQKLIDLYYEGDYGQYGSDGELRVCFTASNHTTGGNSGSPVLDAYGNLIGINFDRSWESTMSDIMYDPNKCRNIIVDVKYVLFIIDKFAGASHLIEEMTLVDEETKAAAHVEEVKAWIITLTDSLQDSPDDYTIFAHRGNAYFELGMYQDALNDYASVLKEDSKNYDALLHRGRIYMKMNMNNEALKELNKLVKYHKDDAVAYYTLGRADQELGRYRDAVDDYGKAIKLDPENHEAYYNRGVCYHMLGDIEVGCDDMEKAVSLGGSADLYEVVCD